MNDARHGAQGAGHLRRGRVAARQLDLDLALAAVRMRMSDT
jgi:hypothetical protein